MIILGLVILAAIMAVFGVICYHRGFKGGFWTGLLIWIGLGAVNVFAAKVAQIVNGLYFGIQFVMSGGLQALGGGGDVTEVFRKLGSPKQIMVPGRPSTGLILVILGVVLVGLLIGSLKRLKSKASVGGMILGLGVGYVVTASLLAALGPVYALLPLPEFMLRASGANKVVRIPTGIMGPADEMSDRLTAALSELVNNPAIPVLITVVIGLFVIVATRSSTKGGGDKEKEGAPKPAGNAAGKKG